MNLERAIEIVDECRRADLLWGTGLSVATDAALEAGAELTVEKPTPYGVISRFDVMLAAAQVQLSGMYQLRSTMHGRNVFSSPDGSLFGINASPYANWLGGKVAFESDFAGLDKWDMQQTEVPVHVDWTKIGRSYQFPVDLRPALRVSAVDVARRMITVEGLPVPETNLFGIDTNAPAQQWVGRTFRTPRRPKESRLPDHVVRHQPRLDGRRR